MEVSWCEEKVDELGTKGIAFEGQGKSILH